MAQLKAGTLFRSFSTITVSFLEALYRSDFLIGFKIVYNDFGMYKKFINNGWV